jgi:hypothetical protein
MWNELSEALEGVIQGSPGAISVLARTCEKIALRNDSQRWLDERSGPERVRLIREALKHLAPEMSAARLACLEYLERLGAARSEERLVLLESLELGESRLPVSLLGLSLSGIEGWEGNGEPPVQWRFLEQFNSLDPAVKQAVLSSAWCWRAAR